MLPAPHHHGVPLLALRNWAGRARILNRLGEAGTLSLNGLVKISQNQVERVLVLRVHNDLGMGIRGPNGVDNLR